MYANNYLDIKLSQLQNQYLERSLPLPPFQGTLLNQQLMPNWENRNTIYQPIWQQPQSVNPYYYPQNIPIPSYQREYGSMHSSRSSPNRYDEDQYRPQQPIRSPKYDLLQHYKSLNEQNYPNPIYNSQLKPVDSSYLSPIKSSYRERLDPLNSSIGMDDAFPEPQPYNKIRQSPQPQMNCNFLRNKFSSPNRKPKPIFQE